MKTTFVLECAALNFHLRTLKKKNYFKTTTKTFQFSSARIFNFHKKKRKNRDSLKCTNKVLWNGKKHLKAQIKKYFQTQVNHIMYSKLLYIKLTWEVQDLQPCRRSEDWLVLHHPLLPDINQSINQIIWYSGRGIYQYNEDDFRFQFWFLPSFQRAWNG